MLIMIAFGRYWQSTMVCQPTMAHVRAGTPVFSHSSGPLLCGPSFSLALLPGRGG